VRRIQGKPEKHWIEVRVREGRKRELRVIAANYGFKVLRLIRKSIGNLVIGNLRPGETREITREELVGLTGIGGKQ
jgi:16S rRNA U516 pseudouridylate synthase RsuA-like enzyme